MSQLFLTPWVVVHQAPLPTEFSRQEYWSGLPFPSPGDLPNPGIKTGSSALKAGNWGLALTWATWAWSHPLQWGDLQLLLPWLTPVCPLCFSFAAPREAFLCVNTLPMRCALPVPVARLSCHLDFLSSLESREGVLFMLSALSVTVPLAHNWHLITIWLKNEQFHLQFTWTTPAVVELIQSSNTDVAGAHGTQPCVTLASLFLPGGGFGLSYCNWFHSLFHLLLD